MKLRTALDIVCLSHNSFCDVVFCFSKEDNVRNRNLRARVVYVVFFFFVTFFAVAFRSYLEIYFSSILSSYDCAASLQLLTCFQVNLLLRLSGTLFIYHLVLAVLSLINDPISIMVNEGFWVLKILSFLTILIFNLFIPLTVWIVYDLFAKFLSIIVLMMQVVILNDSTLLICEQFIVPFKDSGRCQMGVTIAFGYFIPIVLNLALFAYNFIVFSPICTPYLLINVFIFLLIVILILLNVLRLRKITGPMVATLWFTLFIGVLNYCIISSSPHSACKVQQADGTMGISVGQTDIYIDNIVSFILLTCMFIFLCVVTKRDAKKYSYYIESWFYYFVLREIGNSYLKFHRKTREKRNKAKGREMTTIRSNSGLGGTGDLDRVLREINDKRVVDKMAIGDYKIPDNFDPSRVRFRSKQAFYFNLLMSMFGAYSAMIFTSWIQLTIDDVVTGALVYDNTSIWVRFIAVALGLSVSTVKVFRAHYHYTRLEEEGEDARPKEQSNSVRKSRFSPDRLPRDDSDDFDG